MKKSLLILAILVGLVSTNANAQRQQGEIDITAGVGYSLGLHLLRTAANVALTESDLSKISATPLINGMVDVGLTDEFSLGGAYTFLSWNWVDQYTDTNGVAQTANITAIRHNIGARGLFHFGDNDMTDLYAGARVGATLWNVRSDVEVDNENTTADFQVPTLPFSIHALFGVRAYFNDYVGANFEFALGTGPYLLAGGLTFRIPPRY